MEKEVVRERIKEWYLDPQFMKIVQLTTMINDAMKDTRDALRAVMWLIYGLLGLVLILTVLLAWKL